MLDSKVGSLIQDHSNQVEYLHPIKQGRGNGAVATEEHNKKKLPQKRKWVSLPEVSRALSACALIKMPHVPMPLALCLGTAKKGTLTNSNKSVHPNHRLGK